MKNKQYFICDNGMMKVALNKLCDYINHCFDKSDEKNCGL